MLKPTGFAVQQKPRAGARDQLFLRTERQNLDSVEKISPFPKTNWPDEVKFIDRAISRNDLEVRD